MLKPKGLGQDTLIGLSCGGADSISIYAARRSHFHFHIQMEGGSHRVQASAQPCWH